MMDKELLKHVMQRYLEGKASAREKKMIEAWILLSEKDEMVIPRGEKAAIKSRIWMGIKPGKDMPERKSLLRQFGNRGLRHAAIWVVLIGFSLTGYLLRYAILDSVDPIAMQTRITGPFETIRLSLPDSSIVTLAANSSIYYPTRFRGSKRYARLNGKAFFNIYRDPSSPFIVESNGMSVKVLGTSFEVDNVEHGDEGRVTVVTGEVQVSGGDRPIALLGPDQGVTYHKQSRAAVISKHIDAVDVTSWTNNRLSFDGTPLSVVWQVIAAGFGVKIEAGKKVLQSGATFSGTFTRAESLKDILDVVCISSGLSWSETNDHVVIIRK